MKSILGEAEYEANLEDWKAEGLAEGLAEGRAEGRESSKYEIARKMLSNNIDIETISRCTGLSVEEINGNQK